MMLSARNLRQIDNMGLGPRRRKVAEYLQSTWRILYDGEKSGLQLFNPDHSHCFVPAANEKGWSLEPAFSEMKQEYSESFQNL
jgi:hypothetical protein